MIKLSEEQKMVYDDLSMPEKVAIFLIQLGEDATTSVFSHMEIDVITEISRYIAMAKNVDRSVATAVLEEFTLCFNQINILKVVVWNMLKKYFFVLLDQRLQIKFLKNSLKVWRIIKFCLFGAN